MVTIVDAPRGVHRLIAFVCLCMAAAIVSAEMDATTARSFHILAQPLESGLLEFAKQSGTRMFYDSALAEGLKTSGVTGDYAPDDALARLLSGTGLAARRTETSAIALERLDPKAELLAEARKPMPLAEAKPVAKPKKTEPADTSVLPEMTVTGSSSAYDTSYNVLNATTATKTDTPIMETPVSIQVVPQQVLRDQQVIRLDDAIKNVSGVQKGVGYSGNTYDFFLIRGFPGTTFRNGIRRVDVPTETANVELIEVLKGPAAVLYGRIEPGGLVSVITKRPLSIPYYSFQQQFGSFDLYRTTLDATGPITQDGSFLYRFNLAGQKSESFRDVVFGDHIFVAPSVTWRPLTRTEFNLDVEYRHGQNVWDWGIPAIGKRPVDIPIERFLGDKGDHIDVDHYLVDFNWSHQFNDDWAIHNRFLWSEEDKVYDLVPSLFLDIDNRHLFRGIWQFPQNFFTYGVDLNLTGKFHTLGMEHNVLVGGDYYEWHEEDQGFAAGFGVFGDPIDIFSPTHPATVKPSVSTTDFYYWNGFDWFGIYFQDQIMLFDKLHILGGGRYDWTQNKTAFTAAPITDADFSKFRDEAFSPRVGLLYQPWPWISLYANYVESFTASNGSLADGRPSVPVTATQYEAGVKTDLWGGRVSSTLAFFDITKHNILTADLSTPAPLDSIPIGEAQSRGIELDVTGKVTDWLSLIATYAHTDARITKDNGDLQGHRLAHAPEDAGSVWAKLDLTDRFTVGSGVFLVGQREGDDQNTFQLPGYARVDAMAAYKWNVGKSRLTAQININNVLDKRYYKTTDTFDGARATIQPGEPLTALGSIRIEY